MKKWYYLEDGGQIGPVTEVDFIKLFDNGQIGPNTLVWTEELKDWKVAHEIDSLIPSALNPPPPPQPSYQPEIHEQNIEKIISNGAQARPWVRFFARFLDNLVYGVLLGGLLATIFPEALNMTGALFGLILIFTYIFVEPLLLSFLGTTPGKELLNIHISKADFSPISYEDGLKRAFMVWFRGQGAGIPIVSFVTQLVAYNSLVKRGATSWDQDGGFIISHRTIEVWRVILYIIVLLFIFYIINVANRY